MVAADAGHDRTLETLRHIAHALELLGQSLVLAELIFDLLSRVLICSTITLTSGPFGISLPCSNCAAS